jgi:DNA-binding XRE family transcriptional regulator
MPSLLDDNDKAAALARYNAAQGHSDDPKVTKLKAPRAVTKVTKNPAPKRRVKMSPAEHRDAVIEMYKLRHLEPAASVPEYDVTLATRYPEAPICPAIGQQRLEMALKRYEWAMKPQGITPGDVRMWREHFMGMTADQLGAFVRVTGRTIRDWENGKSKIPFSMWWMIHSTLQDPTYFLSRPGFHDYYVDYDRNTGEAQLRSHTWPDICYTPAQLYANRAALNEVSSLQEKIRVQERRIGELTAENTRLRQMAKTSAVANELSAMHAHIGNLLKQIQTADVVPFPETEPAGQVVDFPRQASA